MQVDRDTQTVVCDDLLEDTSVEELRDSLPEHQPRSIFIPVSFSWIRILLGCADHRDQTFLIRSTIRIIAFRTGSGALSGSGAGSGSGSRMIRKVRNFSFSGPDL